MAAFAQIQHRVDLTSYSSFRIGAVAQYAATVYCEEELSLLLTWCHNHNVPFVIVGFGSNLFFDCFFPGLIIINRIAFFRQEGALFFVGAGYSLSRFSQQTAAKQWSGMEFGIGIPGSIGGAICMNAGAHGQSTAESLLSVTHLDTTGRQRIFDRTELSFDYRFSSFQQMQGVITSAVFRLTRDAGAKDRQKQWWTKRKATQPLNSSSLGCIFRNPPSTSAGALIEESGLKGIREGGIAVSTQHANFFLNVDKGTKEEVTALLDLVQKRVQEKTGVLLSPEIRFLSDCMQSFR